jgi:phosphoribosylaminoimidazolecarboxamide formyltransferase/IMP cyclohydrolase
MITAHPDSGDLHGRRPIQTALISVSDKTGIEEFARALSARGVTLISSGGTAKQLRAAGLEVREVAEHTGSPEILGGRVKTLHPRIHGGILARRGVDEQTLEAEDITPIDLVVVNLYPFAATVAGDADYATAVENIDIGGPAMLRAAAKNHRDVTVLVDPSDAAELLREIDAGGPDFALRQRLALKAFAHTAAYDAAIVDWMGRCDDTTPKARTLGPYIGGQWRLHTPLRYGENPHQGAGFYTDARPVAGTLAGAELLQGKALSYNNIADADAAWTCVNEFKGPGCVIVKHANPCGVALGADLGSAYESAYACDATSAFGGIIAVNDEVDGALAQSILERQFLEVLIAPAFSKQALEVLAGKPNVRALATGGPLAQTPRLDLRSVSGGMLVQESDNLCLEDQDIRSVTAKAIQPAQYADLRFAWSVVKMVKSNAIVFVKDGRTLAIGAGQMSRLDSVRIAVRKAEDAGLSLEGSIMASDAFFPFPDAMLAGVEAGAKTIIQPGGSMRDEAVIAAADAAGVAMALTGRRHFRH